LFGFGRRFKNRVGHRSGRLAPRHGHHVRAPLSPAQAVAGRLPLVGSRVRNVPCCTLAWRWPAPAGCGQAPAVVCTPRAWGRPLRCAQDQTEAVAWSAWCFHRLSSQQPRQALGHVLLPRGWSGARYQWRWDAPALPVPGSRRRRDYSGLTAPIQHVTPGLPVSSSVFGCTCYCYRSTLASS
jgi:hypothetical protein